MCPPTDDKPSLKWALSRHVTYFKFLVPKISLERLKLDFKFGVHVDHSKSQPTYNKQSLKGARSFSRDLFNFWIISSKMVQDSLIVSI